MFCCDSWWFLTNDLGELVSNKLLVDAVIHCREAKISCTVFFKTTSSQGKFICYWKALFASWNNFLFNIKVHYYSFDIFKKLDVCTHTLARTCVRVWMCAISSYVTLWSSSRIWSTHSTLWSSFNFRGCPDLGSFSMLNLPSWKRWAQHEIVFQSTVSTPHTSISKLWISIGVFPRNVSILMYTRWSSLVMVPETWTATISTLCRFQVHTPPETNYTALAAWSSPVQLLKWRDR